jgi:hypothetical protein
MTRKASIWLFGCALAVLVLGPLLTSPPVSQGSAASRRILPASATALAPAATVADDDDESRQQWAPHPIALTALQERVDLPDFAPSRLVLARHAIALDPVPFGVRKLPPRSTDTPTSH